MEKLVYDQSQKPLMIKTIEGQIEDVKKQLRDLYGWLAQLDVSLVDPAYLPANSGAEVIVRTSGKEIKKEIVQRENGKDYFSKVKEILSIVKKPLTSREILQSLYQYYPSEFDINDDRKHIASLSAILTEKTADNKIIRVKPNMGYATFQLNEREETNDNKEQIRMVLEKTA